MDLLLDKEACMACMEHVCTNHKCGYTDFNNIPSAGPCPKCGSDMISFWDEELSYRDDDDYDDEPMEEPEDDDYSDESVV